MKLCYLVYKKLENISLDLVRSGQMSSLDEPYPLNHALDRRLQEKLSNLIIYLGMWFHFDVRKFLKSRFACIILPLFLVNPLI